MTGALSKLVGDTLKLCEIDFCHRSEQNPLLQPFITKEMELEQFFLTANVLYSRFSAFGMFYPLVNSKASECDQ